MSVDTQGAEPPRPVNEEAQRLLLLSAARTLEDKDLDRFDNLMSRLATAEPGEHETRMDFWRVRIGACLVLALFAVIGPRHLTRLL